MFGAFSRTLIWAAGLAWLSFPTAAALELAGPQLRSRLPRNFGVHVLFRESAGVEKEALQQSARSDWLNAMDATEQQRIKQFITEHGPLSTLSSADARLDDRMFIKAGDRVIVISANETDMGQKGPPRAMKCLSGNLTAPAMRDWIVKCGNGEEKVIKELNLITPYMMLRNTSAMPTAPLINVPQGGIARLSSNQTWVRGIATSGFSVCVVVALIGQNRASLLHLDHRASVTDIENEMMWICEGGTAKEKIKKIAFARDCFAHKVTERVKSDSVWGRIFPHPSQSNISSEQSERRSSLEKEFEFVVIAPLVDMIWILQEHLTSTHPTAGENGIQHESLIGYRSLGSRSQADKYNLYRHPDEYRFRLLRNTHIQLAAFVVSADDTGSDEHARLKYSNGIPMPLMWNCDRWCQLRITYKDQVDPKVVAVLQETQQLCQEGASALRPGLTRDSEHELGLPWAANYVLNQLFARVRDSPALMESFRKDLFRAGEDEMIFRMRLWKHLVELASLPAIGWLMREELVSAAPSPEMLSEILNQLSTPDAGFTSEQYEGFLEHLEAVLVPFFQDYLRHENLLIAKRAKIADLVCDGIATLRAGQNFDEAIKTLAKADLLCSQVYTEV